MLLISYLIDLKLGIILETENFGISCCLVSWSGG